MAADESIDGIGELLQGVFTDKDGLRRLLEAVVEIGMREEVAAHLGADRHERSDGSPRLSQRQQAADAEDAGGRVGVVGAAGAWLRAVPPEHVRPVAAERAGVAGGVRGDVLPGREHAERAEVLEAMCGWRCRR